MTAVQNPTGASGSASDVQALILAVNCLLDNVSPEHCWHDFQQDWNPIITCITTELLLDLGFGLGRGWLAQGAGSALECTVASALDWLGAAIRSDGSFGTDFWDAARLALLIERHELQSRFVRYPALKAWMLSRLVASTSPFDESTWRGPAYLAVAAEYCRLMHRGEDHARFCEDLVACQGSAGEWQGPADSSGHPLVSPVWHTAQVIQLLRQERGQREQQAVARAVTWLKTSQEADGTWPSIQQFQIYFTAYALIALVAVEGGESAAVRRAVAYLKARMTENGRCGDLGGTVMCAMALQAVVGDRFERGLPPAEYILARRYGREVSHLRRLLRVSEDGRAEVRTRLMTLEEKYKDADIVFTRKQALLITVVSLLVTVAGTAIAIFALFGYSLKRQ